MLYVNKKKAGILLSIVLYAFFYYYTVFVLNSSALMFAGTVAATGLMVFFVFINQHPEMSLPLFYLAQFFFKLVFQPRQIRDIAVFKIAYLLLVIGCLLFQKNKIPRMKTGIDKIMIFFVFVAAFFGVYGWVAGNEPFNVAADCFKLLEIVMMYYLATVTLNTMDRLTHCFTWACVIMTLLSIYDVLMTRRGGTGLHMATLLIPGIFVARMEGNRNKWLVPCLVAGFVCIVMCFTRSYWIGVFVAIFIAWLFLQKAKLKAVKYAIVFIPVLILILTILSAYNPYYAASGEPFLKQLSDRLLSISDIEGETGYRLSETHLALSMISEKPILGWGNGFLKYVFLPEMGYFQWGAMLHNYYVEIALKTGIVGLLCFVAPILYMIFTIIKYLKRNAYSALQRAIMVGGLASGVGWCVIILTAPPSTYGQIFLALSIPIITAQLAEKDHRIRKENLSSEALYRMDSQGG